MMDSWEGGPLRLEWRPFRFTFPAPLRNARGELKGKEGWLLRLETEHGAVGWGEAAPLGAGDPALRAEIERLGGCLCRRELNQRIAALPATLAFALGAALAEIDGMVGAPWLPAPAAAILLPAGPAMLEALRRVLAERLPGGDGSESAPTFKWKVGVLADGLERQLLEDLLLRLPGNARLRLDANGAWDRPTAQAWADRLGGEPRLQWLEQPLPPADQAGLEELATRLPVALDESLQLQPDLHRTWRGWQVRRPSQEGDPRPLLRALGGIGPAGPRIVISTAFETGIGARWIAHLAALRDRGPHPAAVGLAPGWMPPGDLTGADPELVWEAAR